MNIYSSIIHPNYVKVKYVEAPRDTLFRAINRDFQKVGAVVESVRTEFEGLNNLIIHIPSLTE